MGFYSGGLFYERMFVSEVCFRGGGVISEFDGSLVSEDALSVM